MGQGGVRMSFLRDILLLFLALGFTALLWFCRRALYRCAVGGKLTPITVTLTSRGDPGELEKSVRGLIWLMERGDLAPDTAVIIKNGGMDRETIQMAEILSNKYPLIYFQG